MLKNKLFIALGLFAFTAQAQQTPGILSINNEFKIVNYNAETQTSTFLKTFTGDVKPNAMAYDNEDNRIILLNNKSSNQTTLESYSSVSGTLFRSIPLQGKVLGGVYMPSIKSFGIFSVITNFNGYGNNQEDISFVSIDVNTGRELFKVDMSSVSLSAEMLPFYGISKSNQNDKNTAEAAISSLEFLPKVNQVIFCAKDVTGANRIFRIDAATGRLISRQSVYHNILDFAYNGVKDELKAVAFEKKEGKIFLYTIDLDQENFKGSNKTDLMNYVNDASSTTDVSGTSIEFDLNTTYYITQPLPIPYYASNNIYLVSQNADNGEIKNLALSKDVPQFKFGFEKSSFEKVSFLNAFQLYPNPTKGEINISTTGIVITGVSVTNVNGQLVKEIAVDGIFTELRLNLSEFPTGVYFVIIENIGNPVVKRVVVQP
jgi:hypothetical protein